MNEMSPLSSHKPWPIKLYLIQCAFIAIGFCVFMPWALLTSFGKDLPETNTWIYLLNKFLALWGLAFAYALPMGIVLYGFWGIVYKESALRSPKAVYGIGYDPAIQVKGTAAIMLGYFWLTLGLVLLWAVTGVILALSCKSDFCLALPSLIKFF